MTDHTGTIYVKNDIELSWLIGPSTDYVKKIDRIMMWLIVHMYSTLKMKLGYCEQSNWEQFVMKVRQDNDVTDCIGIVYAKNDIELYKPIISGAVCDGTR